MPTFSIPDMSCGHCKSAIQKAISTVDYSAVIDFDMKARKVEVTSKLAAPDLSKLLEKEGYPNAIVS